jgi:hypothetical protein
LANIGAIHHNTYSDDAAKELSFGTATVSVTRDHQSSLAVLPA